MSTRFKNKDNKYASFASPWQDTSRNLSKVDQMLGEYRDHTDDQAQAMTMVRSLTEPYYTILYNTIQHHTIHSESKVWTPLSGIMWLSYIPKYVMLYSLNEGCLF